ncbi:hypothetical protein RSOLAG1IB_07278 [Rhizoctonia solani AG-1 IB]|uniref:Ricin B lectin domain-containing protein n=1 Tax=Thanatephorus cucumeris (strain AG1-IB / isolate 7/3/14) TaxID=1108050 RepID=A0A0B7FCW2_THACB|nr:hypothetical protein RSOLAG1IB_07278 [Rhizoctonia solani AG-1 IB]
MDLDAVSKKVVGHQANGNKSQEWHLRPTAVGTCMAIKTLDGGMTGVLDLRQDAVLECSTVYDLDYMLTIIRADKGFWLAPLSNPYLVYDLRAANPADGTEICLWPKNDLDHQKWYFDPATCTLEPLERNIDGGETAVLDTGFWVARVPLAKHVQFPTSGQISTYTYSTRSRDRENVSIAMDDKRET